MRGRKEGAKGLSARGGKLMDNGRWTLSEGVGGSADDGGVDGSDDDASMMTNYDDGIVCEVVN